MKIAAEVYGTLSNGREVHRYTLENKEGLKARVITLGATLTELHVPDREGEFADVVLGKDSLHEYVKGHPCFGSTCGRVAGRIGGASFEIDGKSYPLDANNGPNCLHGGNEGFHLLIWDADIIEEKGIQKLKLSLTDPHGHNGFPGTLECSVTYALLENDSLELHYQARCDQSTPLNLTNHSYFNLSGTGNILDHELQIFADSVATVDEHSTLIGQRDPVVLGYNDYREPIRLGTLDTLEVGNADIHFFLDGGRTEDPKPAAKVVDSQSGRRMEVLTTEPGVQFYAGLSLSANGPDSGKGGIIHKACDGLCLETQDYADSIHFPEMGGAILQAGDPFESTTIFRFSTDE